MENTVIMSLKEYLELTKEVKELKEKINHTSTTIFYHGYKIAEYTGDKASKKVIEKLEEKNIERDKETKILNHQIDQLYEYVSDLHEYINEIIEQLKSCCSKRKVKKILNIKKPISHVLPYWYRIERIKNE
ncbi:hypothetical protein K9M42_02565 [Patescibacteria group bacterium]|nr:hypothetical protein [Patescibacteria group bacterium]